ncbi:uncharacterized protein TRAVEDRAFT_132644 [Trametes versicolor FP-101664 SS1]|uniref:uncharacterized protein n=1 Tax=Trametes versicolor (strain FP-101664) TaxID=717944 RepID=UPI0004624419|nr:uncharacterized protein TRAVEDRAFT_132644 [Trametes versicolor FP-101664 SS1]EIW54496.1 hypothetical protein TRAVEDRAFT_132644 [Trametes versicolor FP-101664 SS1]
MSTPTTPIASFKRMPLPQRWRPWSQPVDESVVRRTTCGLLNKVAGATFDAIAGRFVDVVVRAERRGDATAVEACAGLIVQRCVADPPRLNLYARMVQRAVDEAEGEDLRWRGVDPYYLVNPAASLQSTLRTAVLDELQLALASDGSEDALTLAAFVGELLTLGVLSCGDVQDLVNLLFTETGKSSDHHCIALCRILRRVVSSTEASPIVDGLSLVEHIESVLEEDTISLKIRYIMMDMLDQCLYPRPQDVFSSDLQRSEVYGLRDDDDEEDNVTSLPTPLMLSSNEPLPIFEQCHKEAKAVFASRDLRRAESFCKSLRTGRRYRFVRAMVSVALAGGDDADANFVATFLSEPTSRNLVDTAGALAKAFEPEVAALEDTVLDIPSAYRLMAIILSAAALSQEDLEDLASRIIVRENAARELLLDEVASLSLAPADETFRLSAVVEETSEDEAPSSEYAIAY